MLTGRDLEVVEFIKRFGVADTHQIARVFFPSKQGETIARRRLNEILESKETRIQRTEDVYTGRYIYFTRKSQLYHKKLVTEFYIFLREGPGKILEFEPEYTIENVRCDAFIAYQMEQIHLFFLEVQISNSLLDIGKYEKLKMAYEEGRVNLPTFPIVVVISRRKLKIDSLVRVVQLGDRIREVALYMDSGT